MIPFTASIRIRWWSHSPAGKHSHRFRLWIPLFLLWILLLPLLLVSLPVVALVCLSVRVNALRLYAAAWEILSSLRHTLVEVNSPGTEVRVRLG
ncbi:hypothetical protein D3C87_922630 [compost metagenome]